MSCVRSASATHISLAHGDWRQRQATDLLVQEENEARILEKATGPHFLEQPQRLLQSIRFVVFPDLGIEATGRTQEEDGGDAVEHLDPLASLASLAADVEHPAAWADDSSLS